MLYNLESTIYGLLFRKIKTLKFLKILCKTMMNFTVFVWVFMELLILDEEKDEASLKLYYRIMSLKFQKIIPVKFITIRWATINDRGQKKEKDLLYMPLRLTLHNKRIVKSVFIFNFQSWIYNDVLTRGFLSSYRVVRELYIYYKS